MLQSIGLQGVRHMGATELKSESMQVNIICLTHFPFFNLIILFEYFIAKIIISY